MSIPLCHCNSCPLTAICSNHVTFYINQLASAQMYLGDTKGAQTTLKNYFTHQFLDQIAASGEQPFEAVRTRPYHYRCFNLEAMIVSDARGSSLGTQLMSYARPTRSWRTSSG